MKYYFVILFLIFSSCSSVTESDYKPLALYSIDDIWWENCIDNDGDGYYSQADLCFDVDVDVPNETYIIDGSIGMLSSGGFETGTHLSGLFKDEMITGDDPSDFIRYTVSINRDRDTWDFDIYIYDPDKDEDPVVAYVERNTHPELIDVKFERADDD